MPPPSLLRLQLQMRFTDYASLNTYSITVAAQNAVGWGNATSAVQFLAPHVSRTSMPVGCS